MIFISHDIFCVDFHHKLTCEVNEILAFISHDVFCVVFHNKQKRQVNKVQVFISHDIFCVDFHHKQKCEVNEILAFISHDIFCIVFHHKQKREVNKILADIIKHMTPDRAFEDHYPRLQSVVIKILTHIRDFSQLFALVSMFSPNGGDQEGDFCYASALGEGSTESTHV